MNQRYYCLFSILLLMCTLVGLIRVKAQQPTWNATGALSMARTRHTATLLANGKVLVVGGLSVANPCCRTADSAELYDPATGRWSATGNPSTARYDHVAVRLANGKVLIAGGSGDPIGFLTNTEIYDPDTGTWSAAGNLSATRLAPRAILLTDGRVLVTGRGIAAGGITNTAEVYDPTTNAWSSAGTMNAARAIHSITLLPNGRVLIAGGGGTTNDFRTAEIYDPTTNGWTLTGELTTPRGNQTATLLSNGKVLVTGGVNTSGSTLANAELYDPVTGQWSATGNLTTPRALHTLTTLPNGKVLAVGGAAESSFPFTTLNSTELYDPATGSWTLTAALNAARLNHMATLLLTGKVLVAGGATLIGPTLASAELFNSGAPAVASISAASFMAGSLAPEAIVAAFGTNLTLSTQTTAGLPLPTQLAGVEVQIRDHLSVERRAPLFFASPTQINYQIPAGTAVGQATVIVVSGSNIVAAGSAVITNVGPGLFSSDASGAGLAAAVVLRVRANGEQVYEPVGQFDSASNRFVAVPIDLSNSAEQVFLLLFGTGFRHRSALSNVKATVGGADAAVLFAGAQGDLVGLDQANIRLSPALAGRGQVEVSLTTDSKAANTVLINIK